jgi:hypothetical protein
MTWYAPDDKKATPFATKMDITSQLPALKKQFLKNKAYANASVEDLFGKDLISKSVKKSASNFNSSVLLNRGDFIFDLQALPNAAQRSPVYALLTKDFDQDGNLDILLGGNIYGMKPEIGRQDGLRGVLLKGDGQGGFSALDRFQSGVFEMGEVRSIKAITVGDKPMILVGKCNAEMSFYQ